MEITQVLNGKNDCSCGLYGSNCKSEIPKPVNWGCEKDGCEKPCGFGGPWTGSEDEKSIQSVIKIEEKAIPDLIFQTFPKAKVEYLKQFNKWEDDAVILYNYLQKGEGAVPSESVDEIWHNMILYTQRYGDFCKTYFGHFVHHIPNDSKIINESSGCTSCHCQSSSCSACVGIMS